jgi:hypothetical protein
MTGRQLGGEPQKNALLCQFWQVVKSLQNWENSSLFFKNFFQFKKDLFMKYLTLRRMTGNAEKIARSINEGTEVTASSCHISTYDDKVDAFLDGLENARRLKKSTFVDAKVLADKVDSVLDAIENNRRLKKRKCCGDDNEGKLGGDDGFSNQFSDDHKSTNFNGYDDGVDVTHDVGGDEDFVKEEEEEEEEEDDDDDEEEEEEEAKLVLEERNSYNASYELLSGAFSIKENVNIFIRKQTQSIEETFTIQNNQAHQGSILTNQSLRLTKQQFGEKFHVASIKHGLTQNAEKDFMELFRQLLPEEADLPPLSSYYSSSRRGRKHNNDGSPIEDYAIFIDCCSDGHCVYVNSLKTAQNCPTCKKPRYYNCTYSYCTSKTTCEHPCRVPMRVLIYRPLTNIFINLIQYEFFIRALKYQNLDSDEFDEEEGKETGKIFGDISNEYRYIHNEYFRYIQNT